MKKKRPTAYYCFDSGTRRIFIRSSIFSIDSGTKALLHIVSKLGIVLVILCSVLTAFCSRVLCVLHGVHVYANSTFVSKSIMSRTKVEDNFASNSMHEFDFMMTILLTMIGLNIHPFQRTKYVD